MTNAQEAASEADRARALVELLDRRGDEVVRSWVELQTRSGARRGVAVDPDSLRPQSAAIVDALRDGVRRSGRVDEPVGPEFEKVRRLIAELSLHGGRSGASPAETAHAVLALREAIVGVLQSEHTDGPAGVDSVAVTSARLVDSLAVLTFEHYVRGREEVISRQGAQLLELSTPVVQLWEGIVAAPLVGTLDSARAQVVMETLLQAIVDERALIAILDITGVPTVDTMVAQHLLKTVTATRLMGADCIISGIRPQTAQTIVQLGIDLADITTRATLADALATAISRVSPQVGVAASGA